MKITSESKCSKVSSTTGWRDGEAAAAERAGNEGLLEEVTSALLEVLRGALQVVGAERAKAREKEPLLVARKVGRGQTRQVLINQVKEFGFYFH